VAGAVMRSKNYKLNVDICLQPTTQGGLSPPKSFEWATAYLLLIKKTVDDDRSMVSYFDNFSSEKLGLLKINSAIQSKLINPCIRK